MSTRKPTKPIEVVVPVIPADEAFANEVLSHLDRAVVAGQEMRQQVLSVAAYYDREIERLTAERDAKLSALDAQIGQQARIEAAASACVEQIKASNVIPFQSAAE